MFIYRSFGVLNLILPTQDESEYKNALELADTVVTWVEKQF